MRKEGGRLIVAITLDTFSTAILFLEAICLHGFDHADLRVLANKCAMIPKDARKETNPQQMNLGSGRQPIAEAALEPYVSAMSDTSPRMCPQTRAYSLAYKKLRSPRSDKSRPGHTVESCRPGIAVVAELASYRIPVGKVGARFVTSL